MEDMFKLPVLHGDGVTDDTEAVQALVEGRYVRFGDEVIGGYIGAMPPRGAYIVTAWTISQDGQGVPKPVTLRLDDEGDQY